MYRKFDVTENFFLRSALFNELNTAFFFSPRQSIEQKGKKKKKNIFFSYGRLELDQIKVGSRTRMIAPPPPYNCFLRQAIINGGVRELVQRLTT
jgi:hypothetical protein